LLLLMVAAASSFFIVDCHAVDFSSRHIDE
jgi:hypothetical protein